MKKTRRQHKHKRKKQTTKRRGGAGNKNRSTASTNNAPMVMVRNFAGQLYSIQGRTVRNLRNQMADELGVDTDKVLVMNRSLMNHLPVATASATSSANDEEKDQMIPAPLSNEHSLTHGHLYNLFIDPFVFTEVQMGYLRDEIDVILHEKSFGYRMRAKEWIEKLLEEGTLTDVSPLCDLIAGTGMVYKQHELEELYYPLIRLFLNRRAENRDRWDINQPSNHGEYVVHLLVSLPVSEFVETALTLGADPTLVDDNGETAEDLAKKANQMDNLALIHEFMEGKKNNRNNKRSANRKCKLV
jgi:hypothetical protein